MEEATHDARLGLWMNLFNPQTPGVSNPFKTRYGNAVNGRWVEPRGGEYFPDITPITGQPSAERCAPGKDVHDAPDAAHAAKDAWDHTCPAERAPPPFIAPPSAWNRMERLAVAETIDNGKPIRETLAADIPLAIDHFRYSARCIRAQEGSVGEIDHQTIAYHFHEPLGVMG
jgi:aldehyde dehydrogenase